MPNLNEYHRKVRSYLEDNYGLIGLQPNWEGDHPYFKFEYAGQQHIITMNRKAEGTTTLNMKLQDIKRVLGPPPPKKERQSRKLEDMMTQPPFNPPRILSVVQESETPKKEATGTGLTASYESNQCLSFRIPAEVVECLDITQSYGLYKTSTGFEIKPPGKCRFRKHGSTKYIFTAGVTRLNLSPKFFSSTKTEFIAVDGHILGSLAEPPKVGTPRSRSTKSSPKVKARPDKGLISDSVKPIPTRTYIPDSGPDLLAHLKACTQLTKADAQKVLDCVKYIEEKTDWRIARSAKTDKPVFDSRIE